MHTCTHVMYTHVYIQTHPHHSHMHETHTHMHDTYTHRDTDTHSDTHIIMEVHREWRRRHTYTHTKWHTQTQWHTHTDIYRVDWPEFALCSPSLGHMADKEGIVARELRIFLPTNNVKANVMTIPSILSHDKIPIYWTMHKRNQARLNNKNGPCSQGPRKLAQGIKSNNNNTGWPPKNATHKNANNFYMCAAVYFLFGAH